MTLTKQGDFSKKVTDLPNSPSPNYTATDIKSYFQTPADELKETLNALIDSLTASTGATDLGAKDEKGATTAIQVMLDKIKDKTDKLGDHQGTWQGLRPSQVDVAVSSKVDQLSASLADIATVNNHTITYTYNPDGSVQTVTEKDSSNNTIKTVTYTYNASGDVSQSVTVLNGKTVTTTYTYDPTTGNITGTSNVIS